MKPENLILVVEDEAAMRRNISELLSQEGYVVEEASDGVEAIEKLKVFIPKIILLDINLPRISGLNILIDIKKNYPEIPVIIFTAYGTSERAIEAMKLGAYDYIEKPFDLEEFIMIVKRALNYSELLEEIKRLRSKIRSEILFNDAQELISRSPKMQEIFKVIGRVAPTDATILIQGESGTGKELIANAIQKHSMRRDKVFIKVNCGALPETLLESEIFGHEKGAFTGAIMQRQGRFELANGGTIFLDEIDSMPKALQIKLLRVLQNGTFERVGGKETLFANVRVIAATNKDIENEVANGNFREDLYYRLNVVKIIVPPLRERIEDIPLLVQHFLKKYSPDRQVVIHPDSLTKLQSYNWPGNIRELENVIHSSIVLSKGNVITIDSFPETTKMQNEKILYQDMLRSGLSFKKIISDIERKLILEVLEGVNWNKSKAAQILQVHRKYLYDKMKELKIISKKD